MRLNMDCVRDILLCVEENTDLRQYCRFLDLHYTRTATYVWDKPDEPENYQKALLEKYPNDVLAYHVRYCIDCDLIVECEGSNVYCTFISDLTPAGHEFIANMRNDTFYNKVKGIGSELGLNSLNDLLQIAAGCASAMIKNHFNLP